MNLQPLDAFKAIPVVMSGVAVMEIGHMLNGQDINAILWFIIGGLFGGIYSIYFLGDFAHRGYKKQLFLWSIPLALLWALDAPYVRQKVIEITISPKYKEYLSEIEKFKSVNSSDEILKRLTDINETISNLKTKRNMNRHLANQKAIEIYTTNNKDKKWWKEASSDYNCIRTKYWTNQDKERARRIKCIEDTLIDSSIDIELNDAISKYNNLITKYNIARNKELKNEARFELLQKKIKDFESMTFPLFVYMLIMFVVGIFIEAIVPHLKYWKDMNIREKIEKNLTSIEPKKQDIKAFDVKSVISDTYTLTQFIDSITIGDWKMNRKIATLIAILRAIHAGERKLSYSVVSKYVNIVNPKTNKMFVIKNTLAEIKKSVKKDEININNLKDLLLNYL